jgi:acetylglutamate kinase
MSPASPTGNGNGKAPLRTSVLKVGGANLERPAYVEQLTAHVAERTKAGERIVLVHGGGSEIGALHDALDVPCRKWNGLRVTSEKGMEITTMVLCGVVNKRVVARLVERGVAALGLSGIDLGLLRAELLDAEMLGRVGDTPRVEVNRLRSILDAGLVPVVAPVSLGPDGRPVNVNADTAAHALAMALRADSLDFVSDVPGVRIRAESDDIASSLAVPEVEKLLRAGTVVTGGMVPKLTSAVAAVKAGVGRVRVGNLSGIARGQATEVVA